MGYKVAVIGATGNVGREMLNILAEREFPADEVFAIASRRSMGVEVSFGDHRLKCRDLENFDFRGVDFALNDKTNFSFAYRARLSDDTQDQDAISFGARWEV